MYIQSHVHVHTNVHIYLHIYVYLHICTYVCIFFIFIYKCVYVHIYMYNRCSDFQCVAVYCRCVAVGVAVYAMQGVLQGVVQDGANCGLLVL